MTKKITEIIFLLDRSGSMAGLEADTIGGFNSFVKRQNALSGETLLTTVLFDHEYKVLWDGIAATDVKLSDKEYYVGGMTALLDAVGNAILTVRNRARVADDVIFVITTDGMENASTEFTTEKVKELIEQQEKQEDWQFIFLGANMDSAKEAGKLGISKEMSYDFSTTSAGVDTMYDKVNEVVKERRKK